jgi:hypothetical protein
MYTEGMPALWPKQAALPAVNTTVLQQLLNMEQAALKTA